MNDTEETPISLLIRARAGDCEALGALLELYRNYLSLLARTQISRRLQGKADPADLVQETFLEAHEHFARFRGSSEAELLTWLRRILAGLIANHVRHFLGTRRRDARLEEALVQQLDDTTAVLDRALVANCSTPSRQVARRESVVLLADALAILPDDYRQVIILRHLEGLSFAEVAECLGRTVPSVQNVWVRALDRLRKTMGSEP